MQKSSRHVCASVECRSINPAAKIDRDKGPLQQNANTNTKYSGDTGQTRNNNASSSQFKSSDPHRHDGLLNSILHKPPRTKSAEIQLHNTIDQAKPATPLPQQARHSTGDWTRVILTRPWGAAQNQSTRAYVCSVPRAQAGHSFARTWKNQTAGLSHNRSEHRCRPWPSARSLVS